MICPKCQAPMRQYERAGVTIDQCSECRGIFLDRGELERLVDAEDKYGRGGQQSHQAPPTPGYPSHGAAPQYPSHGAPGYPPAAPGYGQPAYGQPAYPTSHGSPGSHGSYGAYGHHGHRRHRGHRRKKSLFDDLFG
ncbi:zf-TFIIB domain-containing protein [Cryptosporangium sp. NPDC051539]|uniref:zf-TFIIB domain-containing protein n=1 Tax=Cryptosporangium sp. NPDC051539 TaxID=3363962 RepID=UPI0037B46B86